MKSDPKKPRCVACRSDKHIHEFSDAEWKRFNMIVGFNRKVISRSNDGILLTGFSGDELVMYEANLLRSRYLQ